VYFVPLLKGTGARGRKTRMMGLPGRERSVRDDIFTDRRTDEQTDGHRRQQRSRLQTEPGQFLPVEHKSAVKVKGCLGECLRCRRLGVLKPTVCMLPINWTSLRVRK